MTGAAEIGELSVKLADAALKARENGDEVHAIFFAIKAAETLALAKALGWKPDTSPVVLGPPARCEICRDDPFECAKTPVPHCPGLSS